MARLEFLHSGSITADSSGNASFTSNRDVVGHIEKFVVRKGNVAATGSVWVFLETEDTGQETVDVVTGGLDSTTIRYPRQKVTDETGAAASDFFTKHASNDKLTVTASGLGAGSTLFVDTYYTHP